MTAAARPWSAELLHYWFCRLRPEQRFGSSPAIDDALRRRFGPDLAALSHRPAGEFLGDPLTARAAVLLFDQVPRNLFRGSAEAFAYDPLARAIAKGIMARRWDSTLSKAERQFIYMPFMHSEAIADQREGLRRFAALDDSFSFGFARAHYRMIARFGRFPHRNAPLGRKSSRLEQQAIAEGNVW